MPETYDYQSIKQQLARSIRSSHDGAEMLTQSQAARVLGYKDVRNAAHILDKLPQYEYRPHKFRWNVNDIAGELAKRARLPKAAAL